MSFKIQDRIPLSKFQILQELTPFKRKVKIHCKKLPQDFFLEKKSQLGQENNSKILNRKQIHTQNYARSIPVIQRKSETRELIARKGNLTQRNRQQSNTINLFMGIISSTRQITKSIRKHSLQLRRQNSNMLNNIQNLKFELPPLLLKRQVTTKF